jgi:hypothetical protein
MHGGAYRKDLQLYIQGPMHRLLRRHVKAAIASGNMGHIGERLLSTFPVHLHCLKLRFAGNLMTPRHSAVSLLSSSFFSL